MPMERMTKIKLLEHWLEHPEDMGDIPREMEEFVTTNDIFAMKKEIDWKPFTRDRVNKLLHKAKYTQFGHGGGFHFKRKGNPYFALIIVLLAVSPTIINLIPRISRDSYLLYPAYAIFGFVIVLAVVVSILKSAGKKRKEGRRRDFHAPAPPKPAKAV